MRLPIERIVRRQNWSQVEYLVFNFEIDSKKINVYFIEIIFFAAHSVR